MWQIRRKRYDLGNEGFGARISCTFSALLFLLQQDKNGKIESGQRKIAGISEKAQDKEEADANLGLTMRELQRARAGLARHYAQSALQVRDSVFV